jgi:hypothetical protein
VPLCSIGLLIVAVDPGDTQSGVACLRQDSSVERLAVWPNPDVLHFVREDTPASVLVLEEITYQAKTVGKNIFRTIYFSGRLWEAAVESGKEVYLVPRNVVRRILTGRLNSGDREVRHAILERHPPLAGRKDFASHAVQALGLGLVFLDYWIIGDTERFLPAA